MVTGRVLQFDPTRGYGFVAADDGGDDVFLHASVFDGDPDVLVPGKKVGFQVMAGDRGRKAFAVHLMAEEPDSADRPSWSATALTLHRPVPAQLSQANATVIASAPAGVKPIPGPAPHALTPHARILSNEQACDVLSPPEFRQEFTELLLNSVPELTAQQILAARQGALEYAKKHGWIDG